MGIDKFGRDISDYYHRKYEDEYEPRPSYYELILEFESDQVDPVTKKYYLHETETFYKILLDSAKIVNIHHHPAHVVIHINDKEYAPKELIDMVLHQDDELCFLGSNKEKLFVELLLQCPILFDDSDVGYGIQRH